jgi:hypothetical protein
MMIEEWGSILCRAEIFLFSTASKQALEPAFSHKDTGARLPLAKNHWSHSPLSTAKVNNA